MREARPNLAEGGGISLYLFVAELEDTPEETEPDTPTEPETPSE